MKKILFLLFLLINHNSFADENMARYIIPGKLFVYVPSIDILNRNTQFLAEKFLGIETENTLNSWRVRLRERIGVNIFDPNEAESIGLDPAGGLAYVNLDANKGYMILTLQNSELLSYTLDNLDNPMSYRILEDKYIILSASRDILDYTDFEGVAINPDFLTIKEALDFQWRELFVWVRSAYLYDRQFSGATGIFFPDTDIIGSVIAINDRNFTVDSYTIYRDTAVSDTLRSAVALVQDQSLSLLDYESGEASIVGQIYLDLGSFLDSLITIDKADAMSIRYVMQRFLDQGMDIQSQLFPFIRGRLSYVIRAFDPIQQNFDMNFSIPVSDADEVQNFIIQSYEQAQSLGLDTQTESFFTRRFYGFTSNGMDIWMGVAEGHLIISTSRSSLINLVRNIYNDQKGFIQSLPSLFVRSLENKIHGSQNYIRVADYLSTIRLDLPIRSYTFLSLFTDVIWNMYPVELDGRFGRRDTFTGEFF